VGGEHLVVVAFLDLTERQQLETQLRHAQKLEAVGQLASGIAHEINTPAQFLGDNLQFLTNAFRALIGLVGRYRRLLEGVGGEVEAEARASAEAAELSYLEDEVPEALGQALDGVARVASIVGAMKDFAHADQREMAPADVNRGLLATLTIARNEYKYVADVETQLEELPPVVCHIGDLNQVFLNLIVNAAHAIGDVAKETGAKGRIRVRSARDSGFVRIAFEDTGRGIPPEIRDRVFEPFFTTKEVGRGTGQGLAIARNIVVRRHAGSLEFESEVGKGTTFVLRLPIAGPPVPPAGHGV
jgi:two-component system, NtrC family, sensor kinase